MTYLTSTKTTYSKIKGTLLLLPVIDNGKCDINENQYKRLANLEVNTGDTLEQGECFYKVGSLVKYMLFVEKIEGGK